MTHWDWKLDYYGLSKSNLNWINIDQLRKYTNDTKKDIKEGIEIFNLHEAIRNFKQLRKEKILMNIVYMIKIITY